MVRLFIIALLSFLLLPSNSVVRGAEIETCFLQTKDKYLTVYFPKYDEDQLNDLIDELRSHESKVTDVLFNSSNHYLTVYYTQLLALDDLLYIISKSTIDFVKISGTEL